MGFRGSRVQIPPSRLGKDQALQRVSLWSFFFVHPHAVCNAVCFSRLAAHDPLRRVEHHLSDRLGIGLLVGLEQSRRVPPPSRRRDVLHRVAFALARPLPTEGMPHPAAFSGRCRETIGPSQPIVGQVPVTGHRGVLRSWKDGRVADRLLRPPRGPESLLHLRAHGDDCSYSLLRVSGHSIPPGSGSRAASGAGDGGGQRGAVRPRVSTIAHPLFRPSVRSPIFWTPLTNYRRPYAHHHRP